MDPSLRLVLRSPGISALVMVCVLAVTACFAWSSTRWRHWDAFVELPVNLGGYVLLAWLGLMGAVQVGRWWGRRANPDDAFAVAIQTVLWVALPALLLCWLRLGSG